MVSRRRSLSDEEEVLWSGVTRSVTPLRHAKKHPERRQAGRPPEAPPPTPKPRPVVQAKAVPERAPPLAPPDRRFKQRVASGRTPIDARLDLHGFTQKDAHAALLSFLRHAQSDGAKVVLVVTGKGTLRRPQPARGDHAERAEPGVLRRQVPLWLSLPEFRPFVVSVEDAHIAHGGHGALYVRLRRPR
jgi:DNA-nicking Smr family endonuclease